MFGCLRLAEAFGQGEVAGDVFGEPGDRACADRRGRHIRQRPRQSSRAAGWEISVATSGMERSGGATGRIRNAILIAGPTASGKSALALELAERDGGDVVNADSMQVYSILDVLTARPTRRRARARAARALRPCPPAAPPIRPAPGCAMSWRLPTSGALGGRRADLRRRHRALFPRAGRGHFRDAGHPALRPRALALRARGRRARQSCTASCCARIRKQR